MDVITSLVANPEPPEAVDPGEGSFTDPSMATEAFLGLDATSSDPCCDASLAQSHPTASEVVALVRMQLERTLAWSTSGSLDRSDGIYHLLEHHAVVDICRRVPDRERDAVPVDHNMALRARFAAIRWIRAGLGPPPGAGTLAESSDARDQSIWSAVPNRSRRARCRPSQTPASCQSRSRRQHVTPLPHPISWGNISQGMPLLRTKTMPVRAARSGTRGRPPFGFGGSGGNNGSMISHSSSLTSGFFMPLTIAQPFSMV